MNSIELQEIISELPERVTRVLCPGAEVVVTGCAGFIGSTISEALLELGCKVTGVDCLTDYYDVSLKRENLSGFVNSENFTFLENELLDLDLVELLTGKVACFHLAAQAGVRASWGEYFSEYLSRNVMASQQLLEACKHDNVKDSLVRFVYSSSSSVYGDQPELPVTEKALPQPRSPYGVTKMAAEHLCVLYSMNFGVPTSSLRYFTVFGPRQRPDMAFRIFIEKALDGEAFSVYGDGSQTRDFTYVGDAVKSNLLAVSCDEIWEVFNTGGGSRMAFSDCLTQLTEILKDRLPELDPQVEYHPVALGDVKDTFAERTHVEKTIGYKPSLTFGEGLAREVDWAIERRKNRGE